MKEKYVEPLSSIVPVGNLYVVCASDGSEMEIPDMVEDDMVWED